MRSSQDIIELIDYIIVMSALIVSLYFIVKIFRIFF